MTRPRRTAAAARSSPVEPVPEVPSYCRGLDLLTETSAVEIIGRGDPLVVGPAYLIEAGAYVVMVRASGIALKVFDTAGDCRGIFAGWSAARAAVLDLGAEWEAGVDLNGV